MMNQQIHEASLKKLNEFSEHQPVFMMNYLKYKKTVSATGKTGVETYKEYMKAAAPFFEKIAAEIVFKGQPVGTLLGPLSEPLWDEVLIVRYANKNEFFKLIQFKEYPSKVRALALSDSRLIVCK